MFLSEIFIMTGIKIMPVLSFRICINSGLTFYAVICIDSSHIDALPVFMEDEKWM